MIQRIQSLYLLIVSTMMLLMFFFPIAGYYGDFEILKFSLLSIENMMPNSTLAFSPYTSYPLLLFVIGIIIMSIAIITLYKHRLRQLKLIKVVILLNIILIMGIFIIYSRWLQSVSGGSETFETAAFFPLVSLVFLILAYRGVRKDEKLIRSADRLR